MLIELDDFLYGKRWRACKKFRNRAVRTSTMFTSSVMLRRIDKLKGSGACTKQNCGVEPEGNQFCCQPTDLLNQLLSLVEIVSLMKSEIRINFFFSNQTVVMFIPIRAFERQRLMSCQHSD